ncbi:MAG: RusA family crossover junction endodeoxyribonuclease [Clostridiales Family XIII bacterium]|jgi:Holliday junction resolvase RusA-like endonuclease|nr:RusA family crossover junction endodeoxyribonuclease [Clostridiales Family XIII bacterium]
MRVTFNVLGAPQGKQRPRFFRKGNHVGTYTPDKTVIYENLVKMSYRQEQIPNMLSGAIKAEIVAVFPIPKSASQKTKQRMASGIEPHTKKADCDNIAKAILDALNGIAYRDDAQICMLSVKKIYGDRARVEVTLTEIEGYAV